MQEKCLIRSLICDRFSLIMQNNLHMSKKSSTFAAAKGNAKRQKHNVSN